MSDLEEIGYFNKVTPTIIKIQKRNRIDFILSILKIITYTILSITLVVSFVVFLNILDKKYVSISITNNDTPVTIENKENKLSSTDSYSDESQVITIDIADKVNKLDNIRYDKKYSYYVRILEPYCNKYNLDMLYMLSLIKVESDFKPKAVSFLGISYGYGLMQVSKVGLLDYNNWNTIKYKHSDLSIPEINIKVGTWIYNKNKDYGVPNDTYYLMSAYNTGALTTKRNGLAINYITKIENEYKKLVSKFYYE